MADFICNLKGLSLFIDVLSDRKFTVSFKVSSCVRNEFKFLNFRVIKVRKKIKDKNVPSVW